MLKLQNVVISRGGQKVINGLSVHADRGDLVALIGPNGAGKTTLLHFISGVLKSDSGDVYYKGNKINLTSPDWRRILSYVLDDGGTIPLLTVEEQLYLQCALAGVGHRESIGRTDYVIDLLKMEKYRHYRGNELSSGLRKRLGIGLGIIRNAEIYLFDEPFSALDIQTSAVFGRILKILKNSEQIVIVASHSFPFFNSLCSRVWSLKDGAVSEFSNEREINNLLEPSVLPGSGKSKEIDIPWIG